eukprot:s1397_g13.t1
MPYYVSTDRLTASQKRAGQVVHRILSIWEPEGCFDSFRRTAGSVQDYEEALQDMMENGGFANPAVGQICAGLITLYDAKAGITKDAQYYDRAVEYITMMQQAIQAGLGDAAASDPTYQVLEIRKQKLRRKKERRLAKGAPSPELQTLLKQRPERKREER